jgi:dynein light intermediate chain 2
VAGRNLRGIIQSLISK